MDLRIKIEIKSNYFAYQKGIILNGRFVIAS